MITQEQCEAIEALGYKYPVHPMAKFCVDPMRWDRQAEAIADKLDLSIEMLRVLDIGCGLGYFINACFGHGCLAHGIDIADPCMEAAALALRAPVVRHAIAPFKPLPVGCQGYDLITMFGVNLRDGDLCSPGDYWGWQKYRFFFVDVLSRLGAGGQFVIRPNVTGDQCSSIADLLARDTFTAKMGDLAEIEYEGLQITLRRKQ